ncbi:MAG: hypothetical protein Q9161_002958 [Pseudevernia consocians]
MLRRISIKFGNHSPTALSLQPRLGIQPSRPASTDSANSKTTNPENTTSNKESLKSGAEEASEQKKTQAELDDELRQKLEAMSGDGGAAGLELEDGQPVSMKRGVKNNMFRYI